MTEDALDDFRAPGGPGALRDRKYSPPPASSQLRLCFRCQMSLFSKQRQAWAVLLLVPAIPILYVVFRAVWPSSFGSSDVANIYMSYVLAALPLVAAFVASVVCGSMLPREYSERTAYMTLPMPVSRSTLYYGKFLAGLVLCASVVVAAYGVAAVIAATQTSLAYTGWILASLGVALAGAFFFCAFAYSVSAFTYRGSSVLPLVLLALAIPLACVVVALSLPGSEAVLGYVPVFAPDLALDMLGGSMHLSVPGLVDGLMPGTDGFRVGTSPAVMSAVSLALGAAMLAAGCYHNDRRDM